MATRVTNAPESAPTRMPRVAFLTRPLGALRARRDGRRARRTADAELLASQIPSLRLAWRAAELVVPKRRLELARSLRGVVRDADARYLPNAAPINRRAVRAAADDLQAMADRLAELSRPVAPRGILLVEQLVLDGSSPLYGRDQGDELHDAITTAATALELP